MTIHDPAVAIPLEFNALCNLHDIANFIEQSQTNDGAIYWQANNKLDPWDHTESAMALAVTQRCSAAENAFRWLRNQQNSDGSWYARYDQNEQQTLEHAKIETNFVAYPATGVWHYYLATQNRRFLVEFFPMVEAAINFVVDLQGNEGEIQWATSSAEPLPKDALVTACSSILRSLECAIAIASALNKNMPRWHDAYHALANALTHKPWRFDRTWESKSRYSMDWFYPVLAGLYSTQEAKLRLEKHWHKFVEQDLGCRCVADQPWVTTAESGELVMALVAAGEQEKAQEVFKWLAQWRDGKQGYWTGYNFRDKVLWPVEKTSWTAAAIVLAADALFNLSGASKLFTSKSRLLF